jgi:hypothetical protein
MRTWTLMGVAMLMALITAGAEAGKSGQTRHKLEMTWTVKKVDAGHSPRFQLDTFNTTGKPFGKSEASTMTKASEDDDDRKHPKFEIEKFTPESRKGWVRGSLIVDRDYLKTRTGYQKIEYDGQGAIESGSSRSIYSGAVGRITDFYGIITCYVKSRRCTGSIKVTGYVYY